MDESRDHRTTGGWRAQIYVLRVNGILLEKDLKQAIKKNKNVYNGMDYNWFATSEQTDLL